MLQRKPGYRPLLTVTVLFTVTGVAMIVLASMGIPSGATEPARMACILAPLAMAGTTCVVRKRFFTGQR
jgi:hypothetical protein